MTRQKMREKYKALHQEIIGRPANSFAASGDTLAKSNISTLSSDEIVRRVVVSWLWSDDWIDVIEEHLTKAIVENPGKVIPAAMMTDEMRESYTEAAQMLAFFLKAKFDAYRKAGFSNDDTMRLVLQDQLLVNAGDKQIVQGLSFSDLLPNSWKTPERI